MKTLIVENIVSRAYSSDNLRRMCSFVSSIISFIYSTFKKHVCQAQAEQRQFPIQNVSYHGLVFSPTLYTLDNPAWCSPSCECLCCGHEWEECAFFLFLCMCAYLSCFQICYLFYLFFSSKPLEYWLQHFIMCYAYINILLQSEIAVNRATIVVELFLYYLQNIIRNNLKYSRFSLSFGILYAHIYPYFTSFTFVVPLTSLFSHTLQN